MRDHYAASRLPVLLCDFCDFEHILAAFLRLNDSEFVVAFLVVAGHFVELAFDQVALTGEFGVFLFDLVSGFLFLGL